MKVTIFGTGYVGLVTGACLADVGNHVVCVDVDKDKVDGLNKGVLPIYEPGLEEIVVRNHGAGRLVFTTDMDHGVAHGLFQFIAVGTPPDEDGSADLQHVLTVARTIGEKAEQFKVIVNKSTVPVGTADRVSEEVAQAFNERDLVEDLDVVSNPEFMK
jgi:UDPglucose 6-dehydrogenase